MTKRSKKNRRGNQAVSAPVVKRKLVRPAIYAIGAVVVFLGVGIWWWNVRPVASSSQFDPLIGRWQRLDGGYVLEVKSIDVQGAMDAAYYNPRSIHVAKAEAARDGDAAKVFVELRDVNYPGSTYTLTYDLASDQLKGVYYQAVEHRRFPVVFVRVK